MTTPTCFSLNLGDDHVAHLVLNRPEVMNTMHPTFWRELDELLTQIHQEGKARALVISSTGKHEQRRDKPPLIHWINGIWREKGGKTGTAVNN